MEPQVNLLIIADDEFEAKRFAADTPVDLLISLGDMPDSVILEVAEKCRCHEILAVKGNHDSGASFLGPVRDLHLQSFEYQGITFGGFCGAWKYKPRGHHLFEQEEVEALLSNFPPVDVFIAHSSPRGIHDRDDEVHIGFVAFTRYIQRAWPRLFLHCHQHLDQISLVGPTTVIGTFDHRFLTPLS